MDEEDHQKLAKMARKASQFASNCGICGGNKRRAYVANVVARKGYEIPTRHSSREG